MALSHFHSKHAGDRSAVMHERQGRLHEALVGVFFAGRRRALYRRLAALSGAQPGDRVLDVGCGSGYLTRVMAESVGPDGDVVGLDASPEALDSARHLTRLANCRYAEGTAEALPDPDGTYDVVVTSLMIHHLPESLRGQAVGQMFRVLRAGGHVLVAEFRPPTGRAAKALIHPFTSPAMQHNPLERLEPMLRDAGFAVQERGDLHPWIRYVVGVKPETTR